MNHLRQLMLVTSILIAFRSLGQDSGPVKHAEVNFAQLAQYYQEHPLPLKKVMPINEDEDEATAPNHKPGPASEVHLYKPAASAARSMMGAALLPVSPNPDDSFLSTTSPGTNIPPDTHGAVDSQYCVTAINTNVHIQNRVGGNIYNITLDGFWYSVLPAGTDAFDPRIFFDANNKRWIIVTDAVDMSTMGNSTLLVGVSATNDPTGMWHLYAVSVDPTGATWLDFPNVGYNNKWVAVAGNMFGASGGAALYLFDYTSMRAGASTLPTPTRINKGSSFSICPAETFDPTEPNLFCLETWSGSNGQLNLWKISGPVGAETMTHIGYPATSQHWRTGPPGGADFGPQSGTTNKLDLGDHRITSVIFRNKKLWCAHNVYLPSTGTITRCSIMWWQLDTLANPIQNGIVNDATSAVFYAYPSIAVNKYDDALIGCGVFSSALHPSAGYAWRMHTDPVDSIRPVHIFRHGQATYYTTFGGSKNRWGDYSGTAIDPRNDEDFWTLQEASTSGTSANWQTWWANVQLCSKPGEPTVTFTGATPCAGDTVSYIIAPIAGATSYTWLSAGGWTMTASGTKATFTAAAGADTVVVLAYNSCGQGESHTMIVNPQPLPDAPYIITDTPACTGVTRAVFSASSTGATSFTWSVVGSGWSGSSVPPGLLYGATVGSGTGLIICAGVNICGTGPADTLTVIPGTPVATFSESVHNTFTGIGVSITFTGTATAVSLYGWSFSGGTATPGTGPGPQIVVWATPGTKTVSLTINNGGCIDRYSDTVHIDHNVSTPIVDLPDNKLMIVPNPNEGSFAITFSQPVDKAIKVTLADMQGRIVYSNEFSGTSGNKLAINTNNLAAGVYTAQIMVGRDMAVQKVTITR